MAKTTHTPGPWFLGKDGDFQEFRIGVWDPDNADLIAAVASYDGYRAGEHGESNARLIAAAPELLEACEVAFGALVGSHAADDSVQGRARTRLREVIRKAKGE